MIKQEHLLDTKIGWLKYTFEWDKGFITFVFWPYNREMDFDFSEEDCDIFFSYSI